MASWAKTTLAQKTAQQTKLIEQKSEQALATVLRGDTWTQTAASLFLCSPLIAIFLLSESHLSFSVNGRLIILGLFLIQYTLGLMFRKALIFSSTIWGRWIHNINFALGAEIYAFLLYPTQIIATIGFIFLGLRLYIAGISARKAAGLESRSQILCDLGYRDLKLNSYSHALLIWALSIAWALELIGMQSAVVSARLIWTPFIPLAIAYFSQILGDSPGSQHIFEAGAPETSKDLATMENQ